MFKSSSKRAFRRYLEDSSFIRHSLWKYRKWVSIGLVALVIVDVIDILPAFILKLSVDVLVEHRPISTLLWLAAAYFGISIIQGICRYAWRMYLIRASILAGRDLRDQYTQHLFGLSASFFDRHRLGDLMSLATNDIEAVRIAMGTGLLVFADALFYILTVPIAMFLLSPQLTFWACLPLPLIPWIVMKNEKEVHNRFLKVQDCFSRISALVQESLNGIRVIKGFAKEDTQIRRVREVGNEYVQLDLSLARIQTAIGPTLDFSMSIGLVILLFVGGSNMIEGGATAITLGTFVAFQRYIQKMVWPMAALGMAVNYYQRSVSSSARLKKILAIQTNVPDAVRPSRPGKPMGRIEFRSLGFRFPESGREILKEINLVIDPGERVAFVGSIGAGKSALLSLLPRLYPIERGMLWVDGIDVNDWELEALRKHVGYVSQDVFLFSETVLENVAFGLHEWIGEINSTDSVEQATQVASVHDEINQFSLAYRTQLGERGVNLSGGQRQRLTLARAVAKKPLILVLDDALSSVDLQTEEKILRALKSRPGRNTEMIAAHRISTIKDADKIVVLQDGRIVEQGNHNQLIRHRNGVYWKFHEQQRLKEDLEAYQNELG